MPDLLPQRHDEVDVEGVGDLQQVGEDVRDLLANPLGLIGPVHHGGRLVRGEPLEQLDQFADLAGERHDEVLRRVEALPVPLGGELTQFLLQVVQYHSDWLPHRAANDDPDRCGRPLVRGNGGTSFIRGGPPTLAYRTYIWNIRATFERAPQRVRALRDLLTELSTPIPYAAHHVRQ